MRLLLTGNNDGPLRLARSMRLAGAPVPLGVALQKPLSPVLAKAYADEPYLPQVWHAPNEAATLALAETLSPTHILNCFANYKFTDLLDAAYCLNVHLAPLPKYRGRHPLHWALIDGVDSFGATVHEMNARWDDGAILFQTQLDVPPLWSVAQLREALMLGLEKEFGTFFSAFAKTGPAPTPNSANKGFYITRRYPKDNELTEWHDPQRIVRKVMALRSEEHPAFVQHDGQRIATRYAQFLATVTETPGALRIVRQADVLLITTPNGTQLELGKLEVS